MSSFYHWKLKPYNDAKLFTIINQISTYSKNIRNLHNAAKLGYQMVMHDEQGNEYSDRRRFRINDLSEESKISVLAGNEYHGVAEYPNKLFRSGFFEDRLSNSVGVVITIGEHQYALFLRPDIRQQFGELRLFFALIILLSILISLPCFIISTKYLVQPITRIIEATKRISQGTYKLQLPTSRRDEIGQLAMHFHEMSVQLERSDKVKREFVANVVDRKGIAVKLQITSGLFVYGDEVLFMQVLSNLLSNAVKYVPNGRSIHIRAGRDEQACMITVSDTGDGIPQEKLLHIFDRFYRVDDSRHRGLGSTGLGLSIVRQIVHLHSGTIEAQSEVGEGMVFTVRLPDDSNTA